MPKYYTVSEVQKIVGKSASNINLWCRKLGVEKLGRIWLITDADLARIPRESARSGPKGSKHAPIDLKRLALLDERSQRFIQAYREGSKLADIGRTETPILSRERVRQILREAFAAADLKLIQLRVLSAYLGWAREKKRSIEQIAADQKMSQTKIKKIIDAAVLSLRPAREGQIARHGPAPGCVGDPAAQGQ